MVHIPKRAVVLLLTELTADLLSSLQSLTGNASVMHSAVLLSSDSESRTPKHRLQAPAMQLRTDGSFSFPFFLSFFPLI